MLQRYCDIDEDDLMEMEPWKAPPIESYLAQLSTQSQNAKEKWASILKRRLKKKHMEEEKKAAEQGTVKRIKFKQKEDRGISVFLAANKLASVGKKSPLPKLAPKSPRQKSPSKKLPGINKGSKPTSGKIANYTWDWRNTKYFYDATRDIAI